MFNYKFFFVSLCTLFSTFSHADWTTSPPAPISPTFYSYTYASVFTSCDQTTGTFLATWADGNNNQYPTYSLYTSQTGWSAIDTITNTSEAVVTSNVITSCDPATGTFLATWADINTDTPMASLYTPGSGWSSVDALTTSAAAVNSANSFDSRTGQFLVTWADTHNNNYPTYAFYSPNVGWGPSNIISNIAPATNVYSTFDPTTNQFLAVWVDTGTGNPMYSFYVSGAWSPAGRISNFASVTNDVLCACNPETGQFIATWSDINQNLYPFYSVYTPGTGWSAFDTITTTSGVTDNVTITCDLTTGQYLACWSNLLNGNPTYSFYNSSSGWSQPEVISTLSATGSDIITSFNPLTGQFLAAWADRSNPDLIFNPTFSFFTYISPLPPSPLSFTGKFLFGDFSYVIDILKLEWTPAEDSLIVSYQIKKNGHVIADLPASGPYEYYDYIHNKLKHEVYTIVSVDVNGLQSLPLTLRSSPCGQAQ